MHYLYFKNINWKSQVKIKKVQAYLLEHFHNDQVMWSLIIGHFNVRKCVIIRRHLKNGKCSFSIFFEKKLQLLVSRNLKKKFIIDMKNCILWTLPLYKISGSKRPQYGWPEKTVYPFHIQRK